jgi:alkane 1-monooxygenase
VYSLPITAAMSFSMHGAFTFAPVILAFFIIPSLELVFKPNAKNLSKTELQEVSKNKLYDWFIYLIFPIQWMALVWFLFSIQESGLTTIEIVGRISAYGMLCGVFGINVAHELGHRTKPHEKLLAKGLLLSALYMQFYIEHNKGHHKNVGTPEDPTTARIGEWLPAFWFRSILNVYLNAWKISNKECKRKYGSAFSLKNEMLGYQLIEFALVLAILFLFGLKVMFFYLASAFIGAVLLETVEYIEHYGLARNKVNEFRYENTSPKHSWNSNHIVGRLFLFELSRHSDHHYKAYKKYPTLNNHDESPQMPTGYPGMMLLAAIPPLWFKVMNPKVKAYSKNN